MWYCCDVKGIHALIAAAVAGCSETTKSSEPSPPVALVAPASITVPEQDSVPVEAYLVDSAGRPLPPAPAAWAIADTTLAVVSRSGVVTFRRPGHTQLLVLSSGFSTRVDVETRVRFAFSASGAAYRSFMRWCGFTDRNSLYCLDADHYPISSDSNALFKVELPTGATLQQLSMGIEFMCGVMTTQAAYCWGAWQDGQLGSTETGTGYLIQRPVAVSGGHAFISVRAGWRSACGITTDSAAYCWGTGALGDSVPYHAASLPVKVAGGYKFVAIAPADWHVCGLIATGEAVCWGTNYDGELGRGSDTITLASAPGPVATAMRFRSISAGGSQSCALGADSIAYCWGRIDFQTVRSPTPINSTLRFRTLDARAHVCGLATDGRAYCWGDNRSGQLGNGSTTYSASPTAVATSLSFESNSTGTAHSCGTDAAGIVYCWGAYFGLTPVRVRDQRD